jgi:flagellar biogenesis protein FliO
MKVESIAHGMERETRSVSRAGKALLHQALALWRQIVRLGQHHPRSLRLCESLPLGDRRFVAVVEFERSRFLVGGTSSSLVLLARIGEACPDAVDSSANPQSAISTEESRS